MDRIGARSPCLSRNVGLMDPALTLLLDIDAASVQALTSREAAMFQHRFGLDGEGPRTLEAIGDEHGVSRERVRQIIQRCLRKIRVKAMWQLKRGNFDEACARVFSSLSTVGEPNGLASDKQIVLFIEAMFGDLSYAKLGFTLFSGLLATRCNAERVELLWKAVKSIRAARRAARAQESTSSKAASRLHALLEYAIWPGDPRPGCFSDLMSGRKRETRTQPDFTGYFLSAKLNREVSFESLKEGRFLALLEGSSEVRAYQEQPVAIPYEREDRRRHYFPDVFVELIDGRGILVEIKPKIEMAFSCNWIKWAAMKSYCRARGIGFLITDGHVTIQQLSSSATISQAYRDALLAAVTVGTLDGRAYWLIHRQHSGNWPDFLATVLAHRLNWQLCPFRLSVPNR